MFKTTESMIQDNKVVDWYNIFALSEIAILQKWNCRTVLRHLYMLYNPNMKKEVLPNLTTGFQLG